MSKLSLVWLSLAGEKFTNREWRFSADLCRADRSSTVMSAPRAAQQDSKGMWKKESKWWRKEIQGEEPRCLWNTMCHHSNYGRWVEQQSWLLLSRDSSKQRSRGVWNIFGAWALMHTCFTGQLLWVNSVWTAVSEGFKSVYIAAHTHVCSLHSLNKGHGLVTG